MFVVIDQDGNPIYTAGYALACHEHINDAINEFEIESAGKWKVVEVVPKSIFDAAYCAAGVEPCVCAVANNLDAARYRALRDQNIESNFPRSGVFIGRIPDNQCLTGIDADNAVDSLFTAPKQEEK